MKKILISVLFAIMALMASCSKEASIPPQTAEVAQPTDEEKEIIGLEEIEDQEELENDDANKIISPLDGLKYYPEDLNKRPVAVSIDNHPDARWQAGLQDAEIIYEFQVEYPYTRYLAVFLAKEPERIGPVRSARPYIIYYAMENDGIFVHVGGSEDAFAEIKRLGVAEVDGLYSGAMWRYNETDKFAPHNMYTTLKSIRDESQIKGYRTEGNFEKYSFNEKSIKLSIKNDVSSAKKISIIYNKENTTDYIFDKDNRYYYRFKDKEKHLDELDREQLKAKNIIALEAPKSVLDNAGRLYMETIGTGRGIYYTEGEACEITWKKDSEKSRTKFYIQNDELLLNPGNTWIQIVDSLSCITSE
ncbi:MAG: hypothetical protein K0R07_960 [Sedimentibacter sp.]|jgi:hypothetical protein|nr:hypothetical protein [Sedimentibacter sp.]